VIAKGRISTKARDIFIARNMLLRDTIGKLMDEHPEVQYLGVESPPFGELYSEGLYGLFLYVNEAIYSRRRDVVYFDPLTLKMLVKMDPEVRRGTMDKRDMVDAAKVDTGIKRWNHDEADAYHIARHAARFWEFFLGEITEDELTPSERHSFTRIHTFQRGEKAGRTIKKGLVFRENDRFFRFSQVA